MRRLVGAVLALVVLIAVGVVLAGIVLSNSEVRRWLKVPPDAPDLVAWISGVDSGVDPRVVPLDQMGGHQGGNPFKRASWEDVERKPRPADPRTDPLRGTTQAMYFHTRLEARLSALLRRAHLPNKVLRVGIWTPAPLATPTAGARRRSAAMKGAVCFVEIYSGDPPCREAVEESADRAVQLVFEAFPVVDEVDVSVVPWRTVQGLKPPVLLSVSAMRNAWFGVAGARSHAANLRTAGAVWVDPHVMSGFVRTPVP